MNCKERKHFYNISKLAQSWKGLLMKCLVQALMLKSKVRFLNDEIEETEERQREKDGKE